MVNLDTLSKNTMNFVMALRCENKFDEKMWTAIHEELEILVEQWETQNNIPKQAFISCIHLVGFLAGGNRFWSDDVCAKAEDALISIQELIATIETEEEHTPKMIYSLKELQDEYQNGATYDFLFFWGHTPPMDGSINQSCFSQWWIQDFEIDGVRYLCAEQYMMAEKARLFGDNEMLENIMQTTSPKEMKAYGREVRNFAKGVWDSNCLSIVKKANMAKFSQNPILLEFLLSTQNHILVEASPRDRIWGIGMGKDNPNTKNPLKWRGRNWLGFILTEVRDALLKNE